MGDDATREAERRWKETGALEDGRRYLAHVQRAGDPVEVLRVRLAIGALHPERARLAAHVGHEPARAALGIEVQPLILPGWASALFDWGQLACVRAAVAAARAAIAAGAPSSVDPEPALRAAEAWLACPCLEHYRQAEAFNARRAELPAWAWQAVTAAHCPPRTCWHHTMAINAAAGVAGEDAVRAAIREALVPWALAEEGGEQPFERPPAPGGRTQ